MESDILDFESNGADLILPKPIKMELLNKLLQYCHQFGYRSHYGNDIVEVRSISRLNSLSALLGCCG